MFATLISIAFGIVLSSLLAFIEYSKEKRRVLNTIKYVKLLEKISNFQIDYCKLCEKKVLKQFPYIEEYLWGSFYGMNDLILYGIKDIKLVRLKDDLFNGIISDLSKCTILKSNDIINLIAKNIMINMEVYELKKPIIYKLKKFKFLF